MHRNLSNVEDRSGKENTFVPRWMSEVNSKNTDNLSSQPDVVDVSNPVKGDDKVENVLESDEGFVYRQKINAVIKRKKPRQRRRGKTIEIKAAENNLQPSST